MLHQSPTSALLLLAALLLPACALTKSEAATDPTDLEAIDTVIQELYASVSFPPGGGPDWERFATLVRTDAIFVQAERGETPTKAMSMEGFRQDWREFLEQTPVVERGFTETVVRHQTAAFGNVAHSYVVFAPRVGDGGDRPVVLGVDSIQLVRDQGRWWVVSITTQFETDRCKVPPYFGSG